MTVFVFAKVLLRVLFTFSDPGRRLVRMIRVRRVRSMTDKFLSIHPEAMDPAGARVSSLRNILDDVIERHTQAVRFNDVSGMNGLEACVDTIRICVVNAMETYGTIHAFPSMKTIALPYVPA